MVSPHAQEVEYALILSRMINTVKEDPLQMRLTIYEFARAKLKIDTSWADEAERKRLLAALETAIQGVEAFSTRRDERERLEPPATSPRMAIRSSPAEPPSTSMVEIPLKSAPKSNLASNEYYLRHGRPVIEVRTRGLLLRLAWFSIGILLFGGLVGLAVYRQRMPLLGSGAALPSRTELTVANPVAPPSIPQQTTLAADARTAAVSAGSPPFPLPNDYGVYALSGTTLSELYLLQEQVPDKRVAMSTPVNQPSSTILPDGKPKFVVFRRDLVGNTPDRIDIRVVARVVRALTFDAKGKASFSSVSDAWNIRNLSYEFRVRPIAGNPEMLLVQPGNADFTLPAGRYVLVLKNQGYDFTVAGNITDPSQCLERTDAANGAFYSDCQKQ